MPGLATCMDTRQLMAGLLALDHLVLKVAGVVGEDVFRGMEARLFHALLRSFLARSRKGIKEAISSIKGDPESSATKSMVNAILAKLESAYDGMDREMKPVLEAVVDEAYSSGKKQIYQKISGRIRRRLEADSPHLVQKAGGTGERLSIKPSFGLRDKEAVESLVHRQVFWIGNNYTENLSRRISDVTNDLMLHRGLGRKQAGGLLEDALKTELGIDQLGELERGGGIQIPKGWAGTPAQYFEGLAANTVTNARAQGAMYGMDEAGVKVYVITNPIDERTCPRCNFLNGKTLTVSHAINRIQRETRSKSPDDVKSIHPWAANVGELRSAHSAGKLESSGFGYPPFHFRCRCSVDIHEESGFEIPPPGAVEKPEPPPPEKPWKPKEPRREISHWSTPPKTVADVDRRIRAIGKSMYKAELTSTSLNSLPAKKMDGAAAFHTTSTGEITMEENYYKRFLTFPNKPDLDSYDAEIMRTYVHEHLHGLGVYKSQVRSNVISFNLAYARPIGRLLEEGAVELTAVTDYQTIAKRMGFKAIQFGPQRWSASGAKLALNTYKREVNIVEHLCQVASGQIKPGAVVKGPCNAKSREVLMQMLHRWDPSTRPREIAKMIAARANDVDSVLANNRSNAISMYLTEVAGKKRHSLDVAGELKMYVDAKDSKELSKLYYKTTGKRQKF